VAFLGVPVQFRHYTVLITRPIQKSAMITTEQRKVNHTGQTEEQHHFPHSKLVKLASPLLFLDFNWSVSGFEKYDWSV